MKTLHISAFALSSALLFVHLNGCSVNDADDEITLPTTEQNEPEKQVTLADQEMDYAYSRLYFYYLDASNKLKEEEYYFDRGEAAGYSPDRFEFPDIYYMYSLMGDEHTYYVGPYYASNVNSTTSSEPTVNLGILVEKVATNCESSSKDNNGCDGKLETKWYITDVFKDAPGDRAGLKKGDTILWIDSTIVNTEKNFERLTTGYDGDSLSLKVARGDSIFNTEASLFCYLEPTVYLTYKDSIPVIQITQFLEHTAMPCQDVSDSIHGTALELQNILKATKGPAVINLQGNLGGDITQCFDASKEFATKGDTLFTVKIAEPTKDYQHQAIVYENLVAGKDGEGKGRYFVLMADTNTASCSEMLMLGITSELKSPIVGQVTDGKAIGQYYFTTPAMGYSIVTSMKVLDNEGNSYHDYGFEPDYPINDSLKALEKAVELAKEGKVKRTHGYGTQKLNHFANNFAKKGTQQHNGVPKGGAYKIIKYQPTK